MKKNFWKQGIRFECQLSGRCCKSRGYETFVYLSLKDRKQLARRLKLSLKNFNRQYCQKTEGHFHLKDRSNECPFLKGHLCGVYEDRPTQCRTWPFWKENLTHKNWKKNVVGFCPGIGKGEKYTAKEIRKMAQESTF